MILFNSLWIVNITPFSQFLRKFSSVNVIKFDDDYTIIFPFHKSMEGVIHLRTTIIAVEKVFRHDCYCFSILVNTVDRIFTKRYSNNEISVVYTAFKTIMLSLKNWN